MVDSSAPVDAPAASVTGPAATPVGQPVGPGDKPAAPVNKSASPVNKPAGPIDRPASPVNKPASPVNKPASPAHPSFAVSELAPEKFQERYPSFGVSGAVESKPTRTSRTPLILGVVIVVAGISAYGLRDRWMPAPKHAAPAAAVRFPLQLELQPQANGLINIRWNPESPLVTQAREGRMVITERDQPPKTVALQSEQLKTGHLYFQTSADSVEFRLEVVDRSGGVSQESVMALSSASGTPAPGASPQSGAAPGAPQSTAVRTPNTPGTNAVPVPAQPKPNVRTFTIPPPARPNAEEGRVILPEPPPVVTGGSSAPAVAMRLPDAVGAPQARPQAPPPQQIKVGGAVQLANLIRRVTPVYPEMARKARVQGTVRFSAVVGKGGTIQDLKLIGGPSLLVQAAVDAVRQWVYRPTLLNGEPVEVVTQIEVNFSLSQ